MASAVGRLGDVPTGIADRTYSVCHARDVVCSFDGHRLFTTPRSRVVRNHAGYDRAALRRVGADIARHVAVTSESVAQALLRRPPFRPRDVDLFHPLAYPAAKPMPPAAGPTPSEAVTRRDLHDALHKRFRGDTRKVQDAMAVYDDRQLAYTVPDPGLRAAIVALHGTIGEPAIEVYRSGTYASVTYGSNVPQGAVAQVQSRSDGTLAPVVNERDRYEPFLLLTATMAHEALHQDRPSSVKEELINGIIETFIHAQLLNEQPQLAWRESELAQGTSTEVLALLNTRDATGAVRVRHSQTPVLPPSTTGQTASESNRALTSYADFYVGWEDSGDTFGNDALRRMVERVTGKSQPPLYFDAETVALLDAGQQALTARDIVRVLTVALKTEWPR